MNYRCIIGGIRNLSKELDEQVKREIKVHQLPILLNHVPMFYLLPIDGSGMRFNDLMKAWKISKSSLSDIISKYTAEGIVVKSASAEDKRTVYISMTEEAMEIRRILDRIEDDLMEDFLADFSEEDKIVFEQMIKKMSKM